MLSRFLLTLTTLAAACLLLAQGMFRPTFTSPEYNTSLLMSADVQKELHLSPSVAAKAKSLIVSTNQKMIQSWKMKPGAVNAEKIQKNRETMIARMTQDRKQVLAMLTPAQKKRLRELSLQTFGGTAVLLP